MVSSTYFAYTDIVTFALLTSRRQSNGSQHLNTLLAEIKRLEEQDVIRLGCLKGGRFTKSINSLMENNILMHPDKHYIDLTAKGKRNLALATKQFGSFYELTSRPKQKKFLRMLADPTLSGPLRHITKAAENLVIPEGMMVVCEKNIQNMLLEFGDGLHKKLLATFERLTFNQEVPQVDDQGPPSVADGEMLDPAPGPEPPLLDINPENPLNDEGPMDAPPVNNPVLEVEMSEADEVEDSLPVITGPEEIPLSIEQARAEIERLQQRINEIEAEFDRAKENSERLQAEKFALVEQNAALTGQNAKFAEQTAELTGSVTKLTEELVKLTQQDVTLLGQNAHLLKENARLNGELRNAKTKLRTLRALQTNITNLCNSDDDDEESRSSSSVRDSGVGLQPIKNTPVSPPPSSP